MTHLFETDVDKHEFAGRLIVSLSQGLALMLLSVLVFAAEASASYETARWHPLHFKPAIEQADDKSCLVCHAEVLKPSVRAKSPAGVRADQSLAWYQTLEIYTGAQDTFHRRHLLGDMAKRYMNLRCNTCHQGHDPRDEAPGTSATAQATGYTLRKQVDPQTCLMCHGQFNAEVMGLPGSWAEHGETFGNNCLLCHESIRTTRHNVNFLKPPPSRRRDASLRNTAMPVTGGAPGIAFPSLIRVMPGRAWTRRCPTGLGIAPRSRSRVFAWRTGRPPRLRRRKQTRRQRPEPVARSAPNHARWPPARHPQAHTCA